ncbi:nudC domain-containing protein 3-like, partial [Microplitis demolitor]|uniref:nudC domain-containing protein 3-like n=1 Tax=Microplitis demolitor TaxID=69319 RepID=UPI00235B6155
MSDYVAPVQEADSYNGASHDNFTWSQSISDLDVLLNIPDSLMSPRDLKVNVSSKEIKVEILENDFMTSSDCTKKWSIFFQAELSFPVKENEIIWCMTPKKHIHIHMEKKYERWWEALIVGESKIKLDKIDRSRDFNDLKVDEQMKLQELMWNEKQKL